MNPAHELDELGHRELVLSPTPAERRALLRAGGNLNLEWLPGGAVRIRGAGQVGSVVLSPKQAVRVTTKVPVANILALASLAYKIAPVPPSHVQGLYESADPVDWLAVLLVAEVEHLVESGLRNGYVLTRATLPYVRGRLSFDGTALWKTPGMADCEFSDFVQDTAENRVIRATLELVAARRLMGGLRVRTLRLIDRLPGVSLIPNPGDVLRTVRINRLNQHYEPALRLCEVLLAGVGLDASGCTVLGPAFFFPLEKVFEAAVFRFLQARIEGVRAQDSRYIAPYAGAPGRPLTYRPDVTIEEPPRLVIDTKYARAEVRNAHGGLSYRNDDLYQIAFYAYSLGCPGVLVYPLDDRAIDVEYRVGDIEIGILTVDLAAPELVGLDSLVTVLRERLGRAPRVTSVGTFPVSVAPTP